MKIDTTNLKLWIRAADKKEFPDIDWETCPSPLVNRLYTRSLRRMKIVEEIESLHDELSQ